MSPTPERAFAVNPTEYPFESHWFERGGSRLHYLDVGEGLPILMLHGNPTWSYLYRNVIKALDGECRAIAPDYPGFGYSDHPPGYGYMPADHAEWIAALVDHLALKRFVLMVQDWGGPIGLSVAVERPDQVAGLVIANTFGWRADAMMMRLFSTVLGGPIGRYLILEHNFFASRMMRMTLAASSKSPETLAAYEAPFPTRESRIGTYIFPRAINGSDDWMTSLESRLPLLAGKPVELVMGKKDPLLASEDFIAHWQRHFPDAPVDRIPEAGHYLQEDAPDRVAAAIRRVLARVE